MLKKNKTLLIYYICTFTAVEPYRIITTSIPEGKLEINKRSEVEKIVVCAAFSFLAVVGITGNLLVIILNVKYFQYML